MNNDLVIMNELDQPIPSGVTTQSLLDKIDSIIERSIEQKDVFIALNACSEIITVMKISGLALARILHRIKNSWKSFEIEDDFESVAYSYIGLHKDTIERYITVWDMYEQKVIPDGVVPLLQERNIGDQIPIALAVKQGYEITDEQWQELVNAPDGATIRRFLRDEVKGKEPRSNAIQFVLDEDGVLTAWKDGRAHYIGTLNVESKNDVVIKAIERIIQNNGVNRK